MAAAPALPVKLPHGLRRLRGPDMSRCGSIAGFAPQASRQRRLVLPIGLDAIDAAQVVWAARPRAEGAWAVLPAGKRQHDSLRVSLMQPAVARRGTGVQSRWGGNNERRGPRHQGGYRASEFRREGFFPPLRWDHLQLRRKICVSGSLQHKAQGSRPFALLISFSTATPRGLLRAAWVGAVMLRAYFRSFSQPSGSGGCRDGLGRGPGARQGARRSGRTHTVRYRERTCSSSARKRWGSAE